MSINVYGYPVDYSDELDLLRKVLKVHAVVTNIDKDENFLRPMLVKVLSFYILWGYSKETKEIIMDSLEITQKNLNQINSELTKKKYLVRDTHNFRKKYLSKELTMLKNYFLEGDYKKVFLVRFKEKKSEAGKK